MPYVDNHTLEVGDRVRAVSSLVPSGEFIGMIIAIRQEGRRFNVRPEGEENLREARGYRDNGGDYFMMSNLRVVEVLSKHEAALLFTHSEGEAET